MFLSKIRELLPMTEGKRIRININGKELKGGLNGFNPDAAENIYSALPLNSRIRKWGKEIYFPTPTSVYLVDTTMDVEPGDIAYWEEGNAICIFFGPTPESKGSKPVPKSPVGIIGSVDNPEKLEGVEEDQNIYMEAI